MARKRMIDPSIWTDEGMADLTPRQQLLYIALISNADDDGRLKGSALHLTLTLPTLYRQAAIKDVEGDLGAILNAMSKLCRYVADGHVYLAFRNYREWQQIQHPTASKLPEPPAAGVSDTAALIESSVSPHREVRPSIDKVRLVEGLPTGEAPGAPAPSAPTTRAVQEANKLLHKRCDETERAAINAAVSDETEALRLWVACLSEWRLRYPNNHGLSGPLDWFGTGGPPPKRMNGRLSDAPKSASSRLDRLEERARGQAGASTSAASGRSDVGMGLQEVRRGLPG